MTATVVRTTTLGYDEIDVDDALPRLEIPVTTTLIVAGAIASRDYMPVHHDRDFANSQGSKDIFLNILTTNGLCVKFLHDWVGPDALITKLSIRLGVPAYPNDPLVFEGRVTRKTIENEACLVEVTFTGRNSLGDHAKGTATISVPKGAGK
ncbi:MaoC family dehydratase [Nocardia vaccinii]|uniref:MaoC family dehydratase n=1 Tax=Nocardia vaccinii TaxID=1822 RepID=UPI00082E9036|nr:MaoC family dehydratase [Nocardia vaccinii]